jgi:hypothetical protein
MKLVSVQRRQFLKVGLTGSFLLACAGRVSAASDEEAAMLSAIAAAMLAGMLPGEQGARATALSETVAGVRRAVAGLSLQSQKEVGELFLLLTLAPTRRLLAGVAAPWHEAGEAAVAAFLESWRFSRFGLLQGAYAALHDLVLGAWYARPEHWEAIGYPGTPEVF